MVLRIMHVFIKTLVVRKSMSYQPRKSLKPHVVEELRAHFNLPHDFMRMHSHTTANGWIVIPHVSDVCDIRRNAKNAIGVHLIHVNFNTLRVTLTTRSAHGEDRYQVIDIASAGDLARILHNNAP